MIILGQTLLKLHAGINGTGKGREGLLSCPHFLNVLQSRQKQTVFPPTNPRGVGVISIPFESMFSIRKRGNYRYINGIFTVAVHVHEVSLVFGEIKQRCLIPEASGTFDFHCDANTSWALVHYWKLRSVSAAWRRVMSFMYCTFISVSWPGSVLWSRRWMCFLDSGEEHLLWAWRAHSNALASASITCQEKPFWCAEWTTPLHCHSYM